MAFCSGNILEICPFPVEFVRIAGKVKKVSGHRGVPIHNLTDGSAKRPDRWRELTLNVALCPDEEHREFGE